MHSARLYMDVYLTNLRRIFLLFCFPYTCIHSMFRRYKGEEKRGNVREIRPLCMVEGRKEREERVISARAA